MPRRNRNRNFARRNRAPMRGMDSEQGMLTGGTRDVKPEFLSYSAVESGNDTTTTTTTALPVLRNFSSGNGTRAQIIEVLKVYCQMAPPAAGVSNSALVLVGSKNLGTTTSTSAEPTVFAAFSQAETYYSSVGGVALVSPIQCFDCTDGAGNGILVATDSIFTQVSSVSTSTAVAARIKVLYRIFGASVLEYVGIVQGQQ